jgi:hypothetical protein
VQWRPFSAPGGSFDDRWTVNFEFVITYDRTLVVEAARTLLARVTRSRDDEVGRHVVGIGRHEAESFLLLAPVHAGKVTAHAVEGRCGAHLL